MSEEKFRLRKAWCVLVEGYDGEEIEYGPNAGKVRARVRRMFDRKVSFADITVRREKSKDVRLPIPDEVALGLTDNERDALLHAHGATCGNVLKAGYRDHFYTSRDDETLCSLERKGLMRVPQEPSLDDRYVYFLTTDAGKRVADSLTPEYNL